MIPCMPDHERHLLCCDVFSSNNKVAFILTVCRIQDNDEFAPSKSAQGLLDTVEGLFVDAIGCHRDQVLMVYQGSTTEHTSGTGGFGIV